MSPSSNQIAKLAAALLVLALVYNSQVSEAKLLRRSRYYDDFDYDRGYGPAVPVATGERALITVRGARHPYDGSAPAKIAIEDNPYRGSYPRGVYDRLDGYGGGRYPRADPYGYSNYNGGYGGFARRHDFLDPDFGVKASLRLEGRRRSRCRLGTEVGSEIPELGLDTGRVNIDCDVNPIRAAGAALRVARKYGKYRRDRKQQQRAAGSPSTLKRKRTKISIDSAYVQTPSSDASQADEDDGDEGD